MSTVSRHRFASAFVAASLVAFLAITFSPAISTAVWHLRNRGEIRYAGARIHVPFGWSGRLGPAAAHLEKRPVTVFSHSVLVAWGALAPISKPPRSSEELEQFYASFSALYSTKLHAEDREIEEKPIRLGAGANEAFCEQSTPKDRPGWFRTTCLIWRGTWRASFEGGQREKEQFFAGVLGLTDPRSARGNRTTDE
jgi:hypothetical protein